MLWRWLRRAAERRQAADARLLASTGVTLRVRRQDLRAGFGEYMNYDPAADLVAIDRPVLA